MHKLKVQHKKVEIKSIKKRRHFLIKRDNCKFDLIGASLNNICRKWYATLISILYYRVKVWVEI